MSSLAFSYSSTEHTHTHTHTHKLAGLKHTAWAENERTKRRVGPLICFSRSLVWPVDLVPFHSWRTFIEQQEVPENANFARKEVLRLLAAAGRSPGPSDDLFAQTLTLFSFSLLFRPCFALDVGRDALFLHRGAVSHVSTVRIANTAVVQGGRGDPLRTVQHTNQREKCAITADLVCIS